MVLCAGNGTRISAKVIGTYLLQLPSGEVLELKDYLFFPASMKNLISISMLLRDGYSVMFDKLMSIVDASRPKRTRDEINPTKMWHLKLGHINQAKIHKMAKDGYLGPLGSELMPTCECCLKGEMSRSPFSGKGERVIQEDLPTKINII
ncbi:unnamed protein product [Prunus armeniaca]